MGTRKKWATTWADGPGFSGKRLHTSKTAAYQWIRDQANRVDILRFKRIRVWVDERDGQGWCSYELIDLRELADSWHRED
jgi:hypothetical protein